MSNTHYLQEIFSTIASAATGYNSYSVNNSSLCSFCCVCESSVFGKQGMYTFDVIVICDLHNWLFCYDNIIHTGRRFNHFTDKHYPFFLSFFVVDCRWNDCRGNEPHPFILYSNYIIWNSQVYNVVELNTRISTLRIDSNKICDVFKIELVILKIHPR